MTLLLRCYTALLLAASLPLHAQTIPRVEAPPALPPQPIVQPEHALKDAALVAALRQGGFVLYMRHAQQIPPTSDVCDRSNLTPEGEAQARKVGVALRNLAIPVGLVMSSEPCRTQDTARLLGLTKVDVTKELNPLAGGPGDAATIAARRLLLRRAPPQGSNTLLVSHVHGSRVPAERMQLEIAEIIVYRQGTDDALPVARIRLEAWDELVQRYRVP